MFLVISTSLNPDSRSRILAHAALASLQQRGVSAELLDVTTLNLPLCDGGACYGHPDVETVTTAVRSAQGILVASPIYNYDVSAAAKNLIELTGKTWTDKVVGFLCAAGGDGSFMAPMGLANSLMLDFRSLVLPRFVYATGAAFAGNQIADTDCEARIDALAEQLITVATALSPCE